MPKNNNLSVPLKVPCGRISASSGRVCTVKQIDDLGCINHSENFKEFRKARSSKGGALGGRSRASFSGELRDVRVLVGTLIELLALNRLAPHVERRMRDLLSLLKNYTTLAQYELRSAEIRDVEVKQSNTQKQLIDTEAIRADIEALVYNEDECVTQTMRHSKGGAA